MLHVCIHLKHRLSTLSLPERVILNCGIVGIFSDSKITPKGNPLDTLCATLEEKMQFEEGERDLVVSILSVPKTVLKRSG